MQAGGLSAFNCAGSLKFSAVMRHFVWLSWDGPRPGPGGLSGSGARMGCKQLIVWATKAGFTYRVARVLGSVQEENCRYSTRSEDVES
jgi:hypothetical protein